MKHESILRKKHDLDKRSIQNSIKQIENSIKELDTNYMLEMESLLIQLEYAKSDLQLFENSKFEDYYGEDEEDDD